jgi:hypothetical protein
MVGWRAALALALAVACGGSTTSEAEVTPGTTAGENGVGGPDAGESSVSGGAPGEGTGGSGAGGERADAGAPAAARGGAAAGGAMTGGGSGHGGAAPAAVLDFEPPEGCDELTTPIVAELHCSAGLTCGERRLSVACTNDRGLWTCTCTGNETSATYEIPDLPSAPTCTAAAKVCADPDNLTGEPTCERTLAGGSGSCTVRDDCQTWHLVDGARLRTRSEWQASCLPCSESGVLCCRCGEDLNLPNPAVSPDYRIVDIDPSATCEFMDPLCKANASELSGPETCQNVLRSIDVNLGCQEVTRCDQAVELADGTELTLSNDYIANCSRVNDRTSCSCSDASRVNRFVLTWDLPPDAIETCSALLPACTGGEPVELTGSADCSHTFQTLGSQACILQRECEQPALVAATEATFRHAASTRCTRKDGNTDNWQCECRVLNGNHRLELQAGDAETACTQAADECSSISLGS